MTGSSPRVWGQGNCLFCAKCRYRIIPTRVGTSSIHGSRYSSTWDHPHACGDKRRARAEALKQRRSSPRVWGQVDRHTCYLCCQRIIPTRVGTRLTKNGYLSDEFDHPHACGDKTVSAVPLLISILSSPRVWGQDTIQQISQRLLGIIPTRVGTSHR